MCNTLGKIFYFQYNLNGEILHYGLLRHFIPCNDAVAKLKCARL
ncbi:hypothetical protein [Helicobacter rodentium]|nr:hypothetical protein [Helicobacter rodentium]